MASTNSNQTCPNPSCKLYGVAGEGNIGFVKVKFGRRRRYRCNQCGKNLGKGTTHPRITHYRPLRPSDFSIRILLLAVFLALAPTVWGLVSWTRFLEPRNLSWLTIPILHPTLLWEYLTDGGGFLAAGLELSGDIAAFVILLCHISGIRERQESQKSDPPA